MAVSFISDPGLQTSTKRTPFNASPDNLLSLPGKQSPFFLPQLILILIAYKAIFLIAYKAIFLIAYKAIFFIA
jgi:hypothetical protein